MAALESSHVVQVRAAPVTSTTLCLSPGVSQLRLTLRSAQPFAKGNSWRWRMRPFFALYLFFELFFVPPKKKKEKRKPYAFELPYGGFRFHVAHEHFFLVDFASFILQYRLFFQRWKTLITLQEGGKNLFLWKKFSNREIRSGRNCAKKRATVDLTIALAFARHNMNTVRKI